MELVFICITTFYRLCYQGGFSLTFDANVRRNTMLPKILLLVVILLVISLILEEIGVTIFSSDMVLFEIEETVT